MHRPPASSPLFPYTTLFRSSCLQFSPDGQTLASGGGDNLVKLWALKGTQPTGGRLLASLSGHAGEDRKSTRLNSSHMSISYAVFCLKKKRTDSGTALRCRTG